MKIEETNLNFKFPPIPRKSTTRIVCHHTAGNAKQSVHEIHAYHKSIGWAGCGYNLVQTADGREIERR